MLTIDQLHEYREDLLEDEYYKLIPNMCEHCKQPIIINIERTIMKCSNQFCPEHLSYKAENMFKIMGVKNVGPKTAYRMLVENRLNSHMDILSLTVDQMPSSSSQEVKERIWHEIQKGRRQSLSKLLQLYQLNDIAEQTSNKILSDYNSFNDFFSENDSLQKLVKHMLKSLRQSDMTPHLLRMSYYLFSAKDDLIRSEKYFEIVQLSDEKLRLCITGEVSSVYMTGTPFKPRDLFLHYLNEKYADIVSFVSSGNNVSDSHFLLTDSTRKTTKYRDAQNNGVPILSFSTFCDYLEHKYGTGNEEIVFKRRNG